MRRRAARLTSPIPGLGVALAGMLSAAAVVRGLFEPDYFWHLATGRLILSTGRVPTEDPFSFTWFGEPWIPDQWLGDVLIAAIVDTLGADTVLVLFGVLAAIGPTLVAAGMFRVGARVAAILPLTLVCTASLLSLVTARPQVISLAFFGVLLYILVTLRPERSWMMWLVPPLMMIWANTHGFFIVALAVGFVYLMATLLGRTAMRQRRTHVLAASLVSVAATALTPQGPGGVLYALSIGDPNDWVARNIVEWQSPNFHDPQFLPFLALIALGVLVGLRGVPGWLITLAVLGLVLGLTAIRSIGVGSILMLPALIWSASSRMGDAAGTQAQPERRWLELGVTTIGACVLVWVALSGGPAQVDDRDLPVAGTERLMAENPDVRVLATYGWGGYVLNEISGTGGRVFVDGRMPKYRPDLLEDYGRIVGADPSWERLAEGYGVEAMLLRPEAVITKGIAQAAGWCEGYRDDVQVLLLRDCS